MIPACADCGAEAVILFPCTEPIREAGIVLARGEEGYGYCLQDARRHGWPNMDGERQWELRL